MPAGHASTILLHPRKTRNKAKGCQAGRTTKISMSAWPGRYRLTPADNDLRDHTRLDCHQQKITANTRGHSLTHPVRRDDGPAAWHRVGRGAWCRVFRVAALFSRAVPDRLCHVHVLFHGRAQARHIRLRGLAVQSWPMTPASRKSSMPSIPFGVSAWFAPVEMKRLVRTWPTRGATSLAPGVSCGQAAGRISNGRMRTRREIRIEARSGMLVIDLT